MIIQTPISLQDYEISELLGIDIPTFRSIAIPLLKQRNFQDCSGGMIMDDMLIPEYFGLDMIIAVAFQVNTYEADVFRKSIISKFLKKDQEPIFIQINPISPLSPYGKETVS